LDIRMPNMNGVEATKQITEQTDTKVMILTTFDDDEYILDAIKNGAEGYLLKNNDPQQIKDAIISIYNGNTVLQHVILNKVKTNLQDPQKEHKKIDTSIFTERELSIIKLIAKGLSNKEISKQLFISDGTVANYISTILSKTTLEHRTQIAIYYLTGEIN